MKQVLMHHSQTDSMKQRTATYKKYAYGSAFSMSNQNGGGQGWGMAAQGLGAVSAVVDASQADNIDPSSGLKRPSMGGSILKGAATGAAAGSVAGPWGTLVGGVVGAAGGIFSGKSAQNKYNKLSTQWGNKQRELFDNQSRARIAQDPTLLAGNQDTSYYAAGGELPMNTPAGSQGQIAHSLNDDVYVRDLATSALQYGKGWEATPQGKILSTYDKNLYAGIGIFNNNPQYQGLAPNARAGQYFDSYSNNKAEMAIKQRLKGIGTGIAGNINATPNLAVQGQGVAKLADGGSLAKDFTSGKEVVPLSSTAAAFEGPSHAQGGIKLPEQQAEVEGGESVDGNYVFSSRLGFAQLHKPIAKSIGKIEQKSLSPERVISIKLLREKENQLKLSQDFVRQSMNLK